MAFRVPTIDVSVVDLARELEKPTSYEEICAKVDKSMKEWRRDMIPAWAIQEETQVASPPSTMHRPESACPFGRVPKAQTAGDTGVCRAAATGRVTSGALGSDVRAGRIQPLLATAREQTAREQTAGPKSQAGTETSHRIRSETLPSGMRAKPWWASEGNSGGTCQEQTAGPGWQDSAASAATARGQTAGPGWQDSAAVAATAQGRSRSQDWKHPST